MIQPLPTSASSFPNSFLFHSLHQVHWPSSLSPKHQTSSRTVHGSLPHFVSFLCSDVHHVHLPRGLPRPQCFGLAPFPSLHHPPFPLLCVSESQLSPPEIILQVCICHLSPRQQCKNPEGGTFSEVFTPLAPIPGTAAIC